MREDGERLLMLDEDFPDQREHTTVVDYGRIGVPVPVFLPSSRTPIRDPVPPMTVAYSTDRPLHDGGNGSRLWLWANNYPFSRSTRTCR